MTAADVEHPDLDELRREAAGCTRCELYEPATQTVFGAGPASAGGPPSWQPF